VCGTYAEDFGLLKFMTDFKTWKMRNEMDDAFEKIGTQAPQTFKTIPFVKYSKLTSANRNFVSNIITRDYQITILRKDETQFWRRILLIYGGHT